MNLQNVFVAVVAIATYAGLSHGGRVLLHWIWKKLTARHERQCEAFNAEWRDRIVRHATQGQVGLVAHVCVRKMGWQGLLFPRWTADVVISPGLSAVLLAPMRDPFDIVRRHAALQFGWHRKEILKLPLRELSTAPASDREAFLREAKNAS